MIITKLSKETSKNINSKLVSTPDSCAESVQTCSNESDMKSQMDHSSVSMSRLSAKSKIEILKQLTPEYAVNNADILWLVLRTIRSL